MITIVKCLQSDTKGANASFNLLSPLPRDNASLSARERERRHLYIVLPHANSCLFEPKDTVMARRSAFAVWHYSSRVGFPHQEILD